MRSSIPLLRIVVRGLKHAVVSPVEWHSHLISPSPSCFRHIYFAAIRFLLQIEGTVTQFKKYGTELIRSKISNIWIMDITPQIAARKSIWKSIFMAKYLQKIMQKLCSPFSVRLLNRLLVLWSICFSCEAKTKKNVECATKSSERHWKWPMIFSSSSPHSHTFKYIERKFPNKNSCIYWLNWASGRRFSPRDVRVADAAQATAHTTSQTG